MANQKSSTIGKRMATDPNFARTRENMSEFGRAVKAGKLLRDSLRAIIKNASDPRMVGRLNSEMSKVIKADTTSDRGKRNVMDGNILLLEGFEFNQDGLLSTTFRKPNESTIDRATGTFKIDLPAFIPEEMVVPPDGTTHFKLVAVASAVDIEGKTFTSAITSTAEIVFGEQEEAAMSLSLTLTPTGNQLLFLVLGIKFYQLTNGKFYSLNIEKFNAAALVKIDNPVAAPGNGQPVPPPAAGAATTETPAEPDPAKGKGKGSKAEA